MVIQRGATHVDRTRLTGQLAFHQLKHLIGRHLTVDKVLYHLKLRLFQLASEFAPRATHFRQILEMNRN